MASPGRIIFEKEGVFVHTTVARADEDALVPGKVFISDRPHGIFIEWKALDDLVTTQQPDRETEWTVVDAVGYKPGEKNTSESGSVSMKQKKSSYHKYIIDFDIKDLKSFKRSRPNLGWSYLIFILQDGTTYPALHFHQGGTKALIKELEVYLIIKRAPSDNCLYLVREHDPQALSKSFDELQLFDHDRSKDAMSKFLRDPYTATLGGFSKVTNFLRDTLLLPDAYNHQQAQGRSGAVTIPDNIAEDLAGIAINNDDEPGYEMITTRELPTRQDITRGEPLLPQQWGSHMTPEGEIKDVETLKDVIFRGGIDKTLRPEVWKFLLGYYKWESTFKSRTETRKQKVDDYFRMKLQWKSISDEQERRFGFMKERKNLIDKDVTRTDRTHQFFQGEDNPNITVLYDILMTYCMYNFDLGYVQGMSDLLAPILVIMENEVDAFWCFAGFMEQVCDNFEMDQAGMKRQLSELNKLVKFYDPELSNHLAQSFTEYSRRPAYRGDAARTAVSRQESHDSGNMYFCFRWLLILFKREFNFAEIMRLWETLWSGKPCKNYHLLMCLAVLDTEKTTLIECNFGFTEILKHINDLSCRIHLDEMLNKTEAIYLQLRDCKELPNYIREILGFDIDRSLHLDGSAPSTPNLSRRQTPTHEDVQLRAVGPTNGTNTLQSTPDDSSIEILPEQIDIAF